MFLLFCIRPEAFFIPGWRRRLARIPVALVWLYEGLWSKLLGGRAEQMEVAAELPGLGGAAAGPAILLAGLLECLLAAWVLWGFRPRLAALFQTLLLAGMNAAGLLWAAHRIPYPGHMLVMNLAFLTLAWLVAGEDRDEN